MREIVEGNSERALLAARPTRVVRIVLAAVIGATLASALVAIFGERAETHRPPAADDGELRRNLRDEVRELARAQKDIHPELARFYLERDFEPSWTAPRTLSARGLNLMRALASPAPSSWGEVSDLASRASVTFRPDRGGEPAGVAAVEWALSAELLRRARILVQGHLDASEVRGGWFHEDEPLDSQAVLREAASRDPAVVLDELRRLHEERTGLQAALDLYEAIDRRGGWGPVPEGSDTLELGVSSPAVVALRARLLATGDLDEKAPAQRAEVFDSAVETAVAEFQRRHGLEPDGRVGKETLAALNVPSAVRLRQIRVNLERRRWLPPTFGSEYVWVNVPEFRLRAFRGARLRLAMNVVVGRPQTQTPLFRDELEYVVFNPYWNVPESIALNELLPKQRADASYLPGGGYEVVDAEATPVSWDRLRAEAIESGDLRIRRLPGPRNDLGRVKFMMPNSFNVYLHDTPARALFSRPHRAFSHGCIRLERPMDFASYALGTRMASREVVQALRSSEPAQVSLDHPIPVYVVYFTAFVDEGRVNFREDVYGFDDAVWLALESVEPMSPAAGRRLARLEPSS